MKLRAIFPIVMLAACASQAPQSVPSGGAVPDRRLAECALLEAARDETRARGLQAWPDVLVGCPGHEGLRETMPLAAQSAALRTANRAALPAGIGTARGSIVYRRMITRGVPEEVARDLAATPVFANAAR